ncbi:MAG: hypothetical protein WCE68_13225 [Anaerolineales bacterium]
MDVSPSEAEEALAAIQTMMKKTRRIISSSGTYLFLIVWGVVWLLGFLGSQFLRADVVRYTWMGLDTLGGILSVIIGIRMGRSVRNSSPEISGKRIGFFWLLVFFYCIAAAAISWPADGKQIAMYIVLFVMLGWAAVGMLLSLTSVWPGLILTVLALIGYFLLPGIFYVWMAVLGGGGMIALGLYIRSRW